MRNGVSGKLPKAPKMAKLGEKDGTGNSILTLVSPVIIGEAGEAGRVRSNGVRITKGLWSRAGLLSCIADLTSSSVRAELPTGLGTALL